MKTKLLTTLLLSTSIVFTCNVFAAEPMKMPPTNVTTTTVKQQQWQPEIQTIGTLQSEQGVTIKSNTSGTVTKVAFTDGEKIEKGQVIAEIFPDIAKAKLDQAIQSTKLAKLTYKRNKRLLKSNSVSKETADKAEANYKIAVAAENEARASLSELIIKSPFAGIAGIHKVTEGEYITTGTPIVDLEDQNDFNVLFNIPESELHLLRSQNNQLANGQSVLLSNTKNPAQKAKAEVVALNTKINPENQSLEVRANVTNVGNLTMLSGSSVSVTLYIGQPEQVAIIPRMALVYSGDQNYVYVIQNGKAVKTEVTVGESIGNDKVIITKGLNTNDQVVTEGQLKLHNGANVKIENN